MRHQQRRRQTIWCQSIGDGRRGSHHRAETTECVGPDTHRRRALEWQGKKKTKISNRRRQFRFHHLSASQLTCAIWTSLGMTESAWEAKARGDSLSNSSRHSITDFCSTASSTDKDCKWKIHIVGSICIQKYQKLRQKRKNGGRRGDWRERKKKKQQQL